MPAAIVVFIVLALIFRFSSLFISIRHEKALKGAGAQEFGAGNSKALAAMHILFYVAAITEGALMPGVWNTGLTVTGVVIYLLAALALVSVIRSLGALWTIKIIIAPGHHVVRSGLFRWVRHPNYFLNVLPELIGFAVALNAFTTLLVGIPLYLVPLIIRIRQEERVMRDQVADYT
ncbi:isoprenylcysteine carboxyl methyltransferase family protein [Radicibacter daui]|uniref:isoprenylcysteine carboxyl methyltransferase family protein n=1 Tax=Radicibacter daui TaxID=3064829 RepID=UPI004046CD67